MEKPAFTAVKLQTADIERSEAFFRNVFGFEVTHRYGGGAGDPFEEVVMTLGDESDMKLKFIQIGETPASSRGVMIQLTVSDLGQAVAAAQAANAVVQMEPQSYPEAKVKMAVISTDQNLEIELVQNDPPSP